MTASGFHYMDERRWDRLNSDRTNDKILKPNRRLISLCQPVNLPDWAHDGYIYAFPDEPAPTPWENYEHGLEEWDSLTEDIGEKLIGFKFDIISSDEAYVVDRAHYADWAWGDNPDKTDAIRKYALSRVPAETYEGGFRMPELIIRNSINLERLVTHNVFFRDIVKKDDTWAIVYKPLSQSSITQPYSLK